MDSQLFKRFYTCGISRGEAKAGSPASGVPTTCPGTLESILNKNKILQEKKKRKEKNRNSQNRKNLKMISTSG
jgi:hypothetical protein